MGRAIRDGRCFCWIEYRPLPSQVRFHRSTARFKGFSGPVGSGKSQALCHEAIKLSYLNPGRVGLLGAPTYQMLRDVAQATLVEILQRNQIPFELRRSEGVLILRDTGSKILLRSLDEYEHLRGTNLAWFGVDELTYCSEEAWERLEARLRDPRAKRLCGFAVWTPKGFDWVYRKFVKDPPEGYEVIIAQPMENRYILEAVPDFYERLRRSYDERFYRQEVLGEYLATAEGRVYYSFDRAVHVREVELDDNRPLLWSLDFNVDPMCSIVAQRDGEEIRVLDEIVLRRSNTFEACEEFLNRYGKPSRVVYIYGDASGLRGQTSGMSDFDMVRRVLSRWGLSRVVMKVGRRNPPVRDRVALVNAWLRNAAGEVRLYIHPRCKELIRDLEEVVYKEGTSLIDKSSVRERTHLSDALGYLICQEFWSKGPVGERSEPLVF